MTLTSEHMDGMDGWTDVETDRQTDRPAKFLQYPFTYALRQGLMKHSSAKPSVHCT